MGEDECAAKVATMLVMVSILNARAEQILRRNVCILQG